MITRDGLDAAAFEYASNLTISHYQTVDIPNLDKVFLLKLQYILDINNEHIKYFKSLLQKGDITTPTTLVNVFGGELESLLLTICFTEPIHFILNKVNLTDKLIIFTSCELDIEVHTDNIKMN